MNEQEAAMMALCRAFAFSELSISGKAEFCALATVFVSRIHHFSGMSGDISSAIETHRQVMAKLGVDIKEDADGYGTVKLGVKKTGKNPEKIPEEAFAEWFEMNLSARKNSQCLYRDWQASKEFIRNVFLTGYYTATDDRLGLIQCSCISE